METKKIVIILIALAIAVIAVCLIITSIQSDKGGSNGEYNYSVTYDDKYETLVGPMMYAEDGRTFAIAKMIVKNESFSPGINTDDMVWRLTLDKMTYSNLTSELMLHKDYWHVTINEGKTWEYTVVFEIDKNAVGKKDLSIDYKYSGDDKKPSLSYNEKLKADGTVGSSVDMIAAVQRLYVPAY